MEMKVNKDCVGCKLYGTSGTCFGLMMGKNKNVIKYLKESGCRNSYEPRLSKYHKPPQ